MASEGIGSAGWVRWAGLFAGPVLAILAYLLLPSAVTNDAGQVVSGLAHAGRATAAVAVLMATWWLTEAVDLSVTSLLPLALFPLLGVAPITDAAAPYADPVIFLFMGGFILGLAMQRWGLHTRIALITIRLAGTRPRMLVAGFIAATAMLSAWVSNTATAAMMLPIGVSVIHLVFSRLGKEYDPQRPPEAGSEGANFATCLMLGIAYGASIGGVATLIGTPPNAVLKGYVERTYGVELSFTRWLLVGVPFVLVFLPLMWAYLTWWAFPIRLMQIPGGRELIADELRALGPVKRGEWAVLAVFVATALAWILRPQLRLWLGVPWLTDEGIAMIAAITLFLIPVKPSAGTFAMDWKTAVGLPWGILLLFGGGLSLASAVGSTGVDRFIGGAFTAMGGVPTVVLVVAVTAIVVYLTELTSNTALATTMMPVAGGAAAALGVSPAMLLIPVALASSLSFMLPVATPPNAMVFGTGYVRMRQMLRAGFWLNILSIVLVTLVAYFVGEPLLALGPAAAP